MATGDDNHNEIKTGNDDNPAKIEAIKEDHDGKSRFVIDETVSSEKENKKSARTIRFADVASSEEGERRSVTESDAGSENRPAIGLSPRTVISESPTMRHEKERRAKLGHRRVRSDGQVTYKNILTSRIVNSIRSGIEHAVAGPASKTERDLLMQDFMTVESTPFSSAGSARFVFKTYAPVAFRHFRELFGIGPEDFLTSFCSKRLKELSDSGKSGSIFYLTGDDRFIIKTMQSKECSFLQKLLPGYYMNVHQNPNTLLPKYFGLYCYQCDMKKIKLVAMNNILPSSIDISHKYDLKGATYKCRVAGHVAADGPGPGALPTYKDLDFMLHHPAGLFLGNETYNSLMKTIKRDCTVLESFKIMDYSLLLGIGKVEGLMTSTETQKVTPGWEPEITGPAENSRRAVDGRQSPFASKPAAKSGFDRTWISRKPDSFPHGGLPALDGQGRPILVFIGIIDILQSYKLKKRLEHAWKSVIHDGDTVSVHKPAFYSSRFQKFMADKVFKRLSVPVAKRKPLKQVGARLRDHADHPSDDDSFA